MNLRYVSNPQRGDRQTPHSPLNLNNGKRLAMTKRPQLRSRVKGNLSSTVLKTSGGGDKPAEFNPIRHAPSQKFFMGFQTGDLVKANVLVGKYAGTYTGRIAIRFKPNFKLTTGGKSFDVHPKYLKTIHKADGYEYAF